MTKRGPKTGSVGITLQKVKSKFFRHFQGFLKSQVEKTGAGKGVKPVHNIMLPATITDERTDGHEPFEILGR